MNAIPAEVVIIGAGPCGLFQVFELGLLGISAHVLDSLKAPGGQCTELYPDKPIYDIPALPVCGAQELVDRLMQQAHPFNPQFHLGAEVSELHRLESGRFHVRNSAGTTFDAGAIVIAAGVGSFQPRRIGVEGAEVFESRQIHYRVRGAADFLGKRLVIFGGGDSALDWVNDFAGKGTPVTHVHRRAGPSERAPCEWRQVLERLEFDRQDARSSNARRRREARHRPRERIAAGLIPAGRPSSLPPRWSGPWRP